MSNSTNSIPNNLTNTTNDYYGIINTTDSSVYLQYDTTANSTTWTTTIPWNYDTYVNPLKSVSYSIFFSEDKNNILSKNINGIRKNKFIFKCEYEGNRIQPYEHIMKLIKENVKMSVKVKVSDILTICYTNLQFKEITNNLNFSDSCDFSILKVKFKYDDILYENHKLSVKELRQDKLKKIIK